MGVQFAVVGDVHGHLKKTRRLLKDWEERSGQSLDFVLQVGDFEAHRSEDDLATMAAPAKYRQLGDFGAFYQGKESLPWPLYFIGGNHEPYGFLDREGPGELAENIHYLGRAGRIELFGLQVIGLSGIYIEEQFQEARPTCDKLDRISNKRFIGFLETELNELLDGGHADILLLHDWPTGIVTDEDLPRLEPLMRKSRFEQLGNPYARLLAELIEPQWVFCGHMHVPYQSKLLGADLDISVCCLANVESGPSCFKVFTIEDGRVLPFNEE